MLGCLRSFKVPISLLICFDVSRRNQRRRQVNCSIKANETKTKLTWSWRLSDWMRLRSRILTAKERPVSTCLAYLTFPKLPSPSVRPTSYFDSNDRIPGLLLPSGSSPSFIIHLDSAPIDDDSGRWPERAQKYLDSESERGERRSIH